MEIKVAHSEKASSGWTVRHHPSSSCFWPWHYCGKASRGNSGSGSTVDFDPSRGRWNATWWSSWSVRRRTSTGSAGRTWLRSRSLATLRSGERRGGRTSGTISSAGTFPSTSTSQTTWVTWTLPRHGQVNNSVVVTRTDCPLSYTVSCVMTHDYVTHLCV